MLGQCVLLVGILAVLSFGPREYVPCSAPAGETYATPVPAVGGVALGVWLLAAIWSCLLIRGFRRRLRASPVAGRSPNYPARVELGCVISLLVVATLVALLTAWLAFAHPLVGVGCYTF
jgi:hypothetical protein